MTRRRELLTALTEAGREHSNVIVMFHSALAGALGLSATENKALDLLEREGPMSPGDLARRTGLAPASVTGLLDRLQSKGFVRRGTDPADRRRQIVEVDRGRAAEIGALFGDFVAGLDALYGTYSDDELAIVLDWIRRVTEVQRQALEALPPSTR